MTYECKGVGRTYFRFMEHSFGTHWSEERSSVDSSTFKNSAFCQTKTPKYVMQQKSGLNLDHATASSAKHFLALGPLRNVNRTTYSISETGLFLVVPVLKGLALRKVSQQKGLEKPQLQKLQRCSFENQILVIVARELIGGFNWEPG